MLGSQVAMRWAREGIARAGVYGAEGAKAAATHLGAEAPRAWGQYGKHAARGAAVGAAIGGITGAIDRDRGVIGGVIGGAFWGGAAGIGGGVMRSHLLANRGETMKILQAAGATAQEAKAQYTRGRNLWSSTRTAAGLTGAYGGVNFLMGGGRKRKSSGSFHHGEPY